MSSKTKAPGQYHRNGISVVELFQLFPDEPTARDWFEDIRWPEGNRYCPYCGGEETHTVPNEKPMPYHCKTCRKYFSVKSGTVMQSSRIPLQKWVIGIYLVSTNLKGVSSMKLHRDLGVTQKTAWMIAQKIRQGFIEGTEKLSGTVEVDETYIGGKEKNKHASKKLHAGRGAVGKAAVVGMRERGGRTFAQPIERVDATQLSRVIAEHVTIGSTIHTDEHRGYNDLWKMDYDHHSINHGQGEYVRDGVTTNSIESVWAVMKRGLHGVYHHASKKHLARYVNEFTFRLNEGNVKHHTWERIASLVSASFGTHITYKQLTE